ncbi:MAG: carboxypeptidase-like regulatory domain-containing protein [Nannocystaceae bacterium]
MMIPRFMLLVVSLAGCASAAGGRGAEPASPGLDPTQAERCGPQAEPRPDAAVVRDGSISGVIIDTNRKVRIPNALVVLQSSALQGTRETQTNDQGLYAFRELPPGTYTIHVFAGHADVSKVTTLPDGAHFRANFTLDPQRDPIVCRLPGNYLRQERDVSLMSIDAQEARLLGTPKTTRRF